MFLGVHCMWQGFVQECAYLIWLCKSACVMPSSLSWGGGQIHALVMTMHAKTSHKSVYSNFGSGPGVGGGGGGNPPPPPPPSCGPGRSQEYSTGSVYDLCSYHWR